MRSIGKTLTLAQWSARAMLEKPGQSVVVMLACGCRAKIEDKNILNACKTVNGLTDAFMDVMTKHVCPNKTDPLLVPHG